MIIVKSLREIRNKIIEIKSNHKMFSLIPTMGNIHDGHLSLIRDSQNYDSIKIVTIFVNPLQFDNLTDLKNYKQSNSREILLKSILEQILKLQRQEKTIIMRPKHFLV